MSPAASFPVLVASDGSPEARAAVIAAVAFPWPSGARVTGVIGRDVFPVALPRRHGLALEASLDAVAEDTRRALAERWPRATVSIVGGRAAKAILEQARRRRARAIVVGAQGHSVGSSRVDLQACKLEYSIVSPK